MNIKNTLNQGINILKANKIQNPHLDSEMLLSESINKEPSLTSNNAPLLNLPDDGTQDDSKITNSVNINLLFWIFIWNTPISYS